MVEARQRAIWAARRMVLCACPLARLDWLLRRGPAMALSSGDLVAMLSTSVAKIDSVARSWAAALIIVSDCSWYRRGVAFACRGRPVLDEADHIVRTDIYI